MQKKRKDTRHRYMWRFWLNVNKDDELLLCEELDQVKAKRQFAPTIRNALKLFFDLMAGNTDELRKQFPGIVADLEAPTESPANTEFAALMQRQTFILEQIAANGTNTSATGQRAAVGFVDDLPALPASAFIQDDEPTLTATEARATFAGSMGDLFGSDDTDDLWD